MSRALRRVWSAPPDPHWRHDRWPARGVENLVLSFPKSGRTWLRVLLGAAEAERRAASVEQSVDAWLTGNFPRLGGTSILFSHGLADAADEPPEHLRLFQHYVADRRRVFLVRDPRDVVVSYYFQRRKRNRDEGAPETLAEFVRHPRYGIERILQFMQACNESIAAGPGPVLLLSYEDLHRDTVAALRSVLEFFGVESLPDAALERAVAYGRFENMRELEVAASQARSGGARASRRLSSADASDQESFKTRKGQVGGFREYLLPADIDYMERRIAALAPEDLGYRVPGAAPKAFSRAAAPSHDALRV